MSAIGKSNTFLLDVSEYELVSPLLKNTTAEQRTFLNVGAIQRVGEVFNTLCKNEVTLDIDDGADIKDDMRTLSTVSDNSFEIVYASHCIEHIFQKEHVPTLTQWKRVMKDGGLLIILCPDVELVFEEALEKGLHAEAYKCREGEENEESISYHDIIYGEKFRVMDNPFMAHKSGLDAKYLAALLGFLNFKFVTIYRHIPTKQLIGMGLKLEDETVYAQCLEQAKELHASGSAQS